MPFDILPWQAIAKRYSDTIILGNGSSIAVSKTFSYDSLLNYALSHDLLNQDVHRLFDFFGTSDFELILRIVWQTTNVNRSLEISDARTESAYQSVRDALIQTIRDIHPEYGVIAPHLPQIASYLRGFSTVISLNYDLIVYWALLQGNKEEPSHSFKDCFLRYGQFADDWRRLREAIGRARGTTLVFYPHGNIVLCRNKIEEERKVHGDGNDLLDSILNLWGSGDSVPLFVSEGTQSQKIASIKSSYYLSTVYREVIHTVQRTIAIYGWGLGEQDLHILDRFRDCGVSQVAISVFRNDQSYCNRAYQTVREMLGEKVEVEFFDSNSPGCWIHPPS